MIRLADVGAIDVPPDSVGKAKRKLPTISPLHSYFASILRIDCNSCQRSAPGLGYAILSPSSVSRIIWETINDAFSLSFGGNGVLGRRVLVALKYSS